MLEGGPAVPAGWGCGCPLAVHVWELLGSSFLAAVVLADAREGHGDRLCLQQLLSDEPAGQSGVTQSLHPSHHSTSLFLFIPNCPWPPHRGLVSPGDSWAAHFLPACTGSSLCGEGLCRVQFEPQGLIPALEGTFPEWCFSPPRARAHLLGQTS